MFKSRRWDSESEILERSESEILERSESEILPPISQSCPQQHLQRVGTLLSKVPQIATVMCKYSTFEGAHNSNCNV